MKKLKYYIFSFVFILSFFVLKENIFALSVDDLISEDESNFYMSDYEGVESTINFQLKNNQDMRQFIVSQMNFYSTDTSPIYNGSSITKQDIYNKFLSADNYFMVFYPTYNNGNNSDSERKRVTIYFWDSNELNLDKFYFLSDDSNSNEIIWFDKTNLNDKLYYIDIGSSSVANFMTLSCYNTTNTAGHLYLQLKSDCYYRRYTSFKYKSTVDIYYDSEGNIILPANYSISSGTGDEIDDENRFNLRTMIDDYFGGFSNDIFYDYIALFIFIIIVVFFIKVFSILFLK